MPLFSSILSFSLKNGSNFEKMIFSSKGIVFEKILDLKGIFGAKNDDFAFGVLMKNRGFFEVWSKNERLRVVFVRAK